MTNTASLILRGSTPRLAASRGFIWTMRAVVPSRDRRKREMKASVSSKSANATGQRLFFRDPRESSDDDWQIQRGYADDAVGAADGVPVEGNLIGDHGRRVG